MGKDRTLVASILLAVLASALSPVLLVQASPETVLSVEPNNISVNIDDSFSVDVNVADVVKLYGYQFDILYDTNILTATDLAPHQGTTNEPGFFHPTYQIWYHLIDDDTGRISIAITPPLGTTEGRDGNGKLATITFNAAASGQTALAFAKTILTNPDASSIPHSVLDGSVTVRPHTQPIVAATLDIDRDTLNLRSKGKWITAYIQLPEGYNPGDIDASSILLNRTIQPVLDPKYGFVTNSGKYLVDHNKDGTLERMVEFDRASVQSFIYDQGIRHGNVALTITGELLDGTCFEGTDIISVKYAGDANHDGTVNVFDICVVKAHWGTNCSDTDFNKDSTTNTFDILILKDNWGQATS